MTLALATFKNICVYEQKIQVSCALFSIIAYLYGGNGTCIFCPYIICNSDRVTDSLDYFYLTYDILKRSAYVLSDWGQNTIQYNTIPVQKLLIAVNTKGVLSLIKIIIASKLGWKVVKCEPNLANFRHIGLFSYWDPLVDCVQYILNPSIMA